MSPHPHTMSLDRVYIRCGAQRARAQSLGAEFDMNARFWYFQGADASVLAADFPLREGDQETIAEALAATASAASASSPPARGAVLGVPFAEKDEAKAAGAWWDPVNKHWFVGPSGNAEALLARWPPTPAKAAAPRKTSASASPSPASSAAMSASSPSPAPAVASSSASDAATESLVRGLAALPMPSSSAVALSSSSSSWSGEANANEEAVMTSLQARFEACAVSISETDAAQNVACSSEPVAASSSSNPSVGANANISASASVNASSSVPLLFPLARKNAHPRDSAIVFHEGPHVYEINGRRASLSVTGLVHQVWRALHSHGADCTSRGFPLTCMCMKYFSDESQYFPAFRADDVIARMLGGKTFPLAKNHERYRAMPLWQASATGELMDTYVSLYLCSLNCRVMFRVVLF